MVVHVRRSFSATEEHDKPPHAAARKTTRSRVLTPIPQVREHALHEDHGVNRQSATQHTAVFVHAQPAAAVHEHGLLVVPLPAAAQQRCSGQVSALVLLHWPDTAAMALNTNPSRTG